jgi:transposase
VVEAYLAGEGSLKGLATKAGVDHSLVHYWLKKYHAGELSLDQLREEESVETAQHIAALERKVGPLTMELDLLKRGLIAAPATSSARSLIISGPAGSAPGEDVA